VTESAERSCYAVDGLMRQTGFAGVFYEPKNCVTCKETVSVAVESLEGGVSDAFGSDLPELNRCPRCGGADLDTLLHEEGSMQGECPRCGGQMALQMAGIWD
jgi:ssDNA-binding Zn-finger/Zn-ribbon topoisomerase 1